MHAGKEIMKRIDDLLIWLAAAIGLGLGLWSVAAGPVSGHFFFGMAALTIVASLVSLAERKRWKLRQQSHATELHEVMSEYQVLSNEAMAHAELQFTSLETDMREA